MIKLNVYDIELEVSILYSECYFLSIKWNETDSIDLINQIPGKYYTEELDLAISGRMTNIIIEAEDLDTGIKKLYNSVKFEMEKIKRQYKK